MNPQIESFSSSQCPRLPSFYNNGLWKGRLLRVHRKTTWDKRMSCWIFSFYLFTRSCSQMRMKMGTSHRNNEKILQIFPTLTLWILFVDHNLPPHPQGFWFPLFCLHITCFWFTPSPLWECVFKCLFCRQASGWRPAYLSASVHRSQLFSGLWNKKVEPDPVPWWHTLLMSIMLPEICLTGSGQACIASPHMLCLLCSEKDEMLQYLYNGLMVPVGLSVFWNATKHGLCAKFQTKDTAFVLGFYSNEHWLFCVKAPKKNKSSSSKVYLWQTPCLVEKLCRTTHRWSIQLMITCSFLSHCLIHACGVTTADLLLCTD